MSIDIAQLALAAGRVLLIGLLFGAGLPALFAWAMRLRARGTGHLALPDGGGERRAQPTALGASYVLFAVVIAAVVIGVLYITRHSLDHYLHISLFGA